MRLYSYFRSSAAYRVRIALSLKGLSYETVSKSLLDNQHRSSDYLERNPQGLIPAIEIDEHVISQSLAIIELLEELYPEPALLPPQPLARAQVRSMALAIACDIHPLNNLRVLNYLRERLALTDSAVSAWYAHWIAEGFAGLETLAARYSTHARYCFGDSVSLADVFLVPQIFNARRFNVDISGFPTLIRISDHLQSLPQFAAAHPSVQPDAS